MSAKALVAGDQSASVPPARRPLPPMDSRGGSAAAKSYQTRRGGGGEEKGVFPLFGLALARLFRGRPRPAPCPRLSLRRSRIRPRCHAATAGARRHAYPRVRHAPRSGVRSVSGTGWSGRAAMWFEERQVPCSPLFLKEQWLPLVAKTPGGALASG